MSAPPLLGTDASDAVRPARLAGMTPRVNVVVWAALLAVFVLPELSFGIETALHFSGSPIDGPFQLYNSLRRIAAGFRPGVDFQFFHGLGIPYAHYWLFRLLGGRFQDAELARELIATVAFPLSTLLFFRAFVGSWTRATAAAATALAIVFALKLAPLLFALNSMVGLRSTLPTLLVAVLFVSRNRARRVILGGATLGTALFVSTEQGLAILAAFALVSLLTIVRRAPRRAAVIDAVATVAIAVLTLCTALVIVGGVSGARGALRYNFKYVPMDQYWFFGSPPNPFVSSWSAGLQMVVQTPMIGLALLLGTSSAILYCARLWRVGPTDNGRREFALALLAVYGILSCGSLLGVFIPAYAGPCWRALILLALVELTTAAQRRAGAGVSWLGVPKVSAFAAFGAAAWAIMTARTILIGLVVWLPHIVADHVVHRVGFSIGGIWPETMATDTRVIDAHRGPRGEAPLLWSTYAGWAEAQTGVFHPSFDYIIHALGPENRVAYVERFQAVRPPLVQTILPTYTVYEPWLENTNWDFYREVLRSYRVVDRTAWSVWWERVTAPAPAPRLLSGVNVPPGASAVQLAPVPVDSSSPVTLLEVEVEYDAVNPLGWLPVIGPMPRYLVGIEGAVSTAPVTLNPYVHRFRFPLLARGGQMPTLRFQPFSLLPGARLSVKAVRASVVFVDPRNLPWLRELAARSGS